MDIKTVEKRRAILINTAYYAVFAALGFLILKYAVGWVMPFIIGFIIALLLRPATVFICKRTKMSRGLCAAFTMLLFYIALGVTLYFTGARLLEFIIHLCKSIPEFYDKSIGPSIQKLNEIITEFTQHIGAQPQNGDFGGINSSMSDFIFGISSKLLSFAAGMTSRLPSIMMFSVFTVISSFFISMEFDKIIQFVSMHLPERWTDRAKDFNRFLKTTVKQYIKAYLILMTITFAELSVGFYIIGVKRALLVALIIAIGDALPVIGTGIMVIPWILIEMANGNFSFAISLTVLYIIVTLIRNIIEPRIVGNQLGQNPLITLIAIYLGYKLIGVAGMIAAPITAQIFTQYYREGKLKLDNLGEKM